MSAAARIALPAAAGGLICAAFSLALPSADRLAPPRVFFPPDLAYWLQQSPESAGLIASAGAGAVAGLATVFLSGGDEKRGALAPDLFALLNPLALLALSLGAQGALLFAAALVFWRAVIALSARRDASATVALGAAVAVAPFLSNAVLALYPFLLLALPFLSPWGAQPKQLAGFAMAVGAPFLLACFSAGYLSWLFGAPDDVAGAADLAGFSADYLLILAGGFIIALAGRISSRLAQAGAMLAAAGLIAAGKPQILAWLSSVVS